MKLCKLSGSLRRATTIAICFVLCSPVYAATGYSVSAGVSHSDNIRRTPEDGALDDTVSNLTAAFVWSNESPRLSASLFGQATYFDYMDDTFDSELVPRGTLNIDWNILPARLNWVVEDRFGQIASDPFSAFTPDRIEDVNIASTGPDFTFGSSPTQLLVIGFRGEDQTYEDRPVDNQRVSGRIELTRQISNRRTIGLGAFAESVEFEESAFNTDFDLYEAFVTFGSSIGDYQLELDAGMTAIEINDETADGVLGRLTISRAVDSGWFFSASGEFSFTDSGSRFLVGREQSTAGPGVTVDDDALVAAGSPLRLEHFDFAVGHVGNRHSLDLSLYWETERFETESPLDREQAGAALTYDFSLTPVDSVSLRANYRNVQFDTIDRDDDTLEVELRFQRNLTQNLALILRAARLERDSTSGPSQFEENIYGLILSYRSDLLDALR